MTVDLPSTAPNSLARVVGKTVRADLARSLPFMPLYSLAEVTLGLLAAAMLRLIYIDTPRVFVADLFPERLRQWLVFPQSLDRKDLAMVIPLLIIGIGLFKLLTSFASTYYMERAGYLVSTKLREVLLASLLNAPSETLQRAHHSELSNRIMADSTVMQGAVSKGVLGGLRDLLVVLFCFVGMILVAGDVMIWVVLGLAPFILVIRYIAKVVQGYIRSYRRGVIELSSHAMDSRLGLLTLAAERTTTLRLQDFVNKTEGLRAGAMSTMGRRTLSGPFVEYLAIAGVAALLAFKNRLSDVDVAAFGALFILAVMTYRPLKNLGGFMSQVAELRLTYQRLNALWLENRAAFRVPSFSGTLAPVLLSCEGVSYGSSAGTTVLRGFRCSLKQGEILGFAGPSGSGKTTALRLMAGTLLPTEGHITRHGDVRLATQAAAVFAGSVADNMAYEHPVQTCEEVLKDLILGLGLAATNAGAALFLSRVIGPAGEGLSGGERARVTLARVLVSMVMAGRAGTPMVGLFDEPTANLDPQASQGFWLALRKIVGEHPTVSAVCVTHHEADLIHCQRIIRFAAGALTQQEGHDD